MIILWFVFALIVGAIGANRRIGFWGAFLLSLILSPLIGFIITIVSKSNEQENRERQTMEQHRAQTAALQEMAARQSAVPKTITEELAQLKGLLDQGAITQAQYDAAVAKVTGVGA